MEIKSIIIFLLMMVSEIQSARILVVVPTATVSHYACARKIIQELCKRGHQVVSISSYEEKNAPKNYRWIPVRAKSVLEAVPDMAEELKKELNFFSGQLRLWRIMNSYTKHILNSEELRRFMEEDDSQFDLVIAEDFFHQIFYVFSYKYRAPLVLLSTFGMGHYMNEYLGNPLELSYVPHEFYAAYGDMTLFERFKNLAYTIYDIFGRKYYSLSFQNLLAKEVFKGLDEIPEVEDLERNASLLLINAHYSTSVVRPLVPNILEIGGIHMDPVKPLNGELKRILDEATEGAVLVSFGSVMDLSQQPRDKLLVILQALGGLSQRVVLKWNSDDTLPVKFRNIHPYKWIPQNDVLAHPNLLAFVTHGGLHSAFEAIYHGVPTICVPFFGDQPLNCEKSSKMGYGIALNMKTLDREILSKALHDILYAKNYKSRAKDLSRIFRDRPIEVINDTIFWIEYVMRHRGADFLKSPRRNIPWYSYYMVDIGVIVLGVLYTMLMIVKYCVKMMIGIMKKGDKLKKT